MTIKQLLETALLPMGKTLYVWGGGWESGAGYLGLNPKWEAFFQEQDASYDFHDYLDQYELGLDCSGYVGWVVNNLFHNCKGAEAISKDKAGYVRKASTQACFFSSLGFGSYIPKDQVICHRAGDIMSTEGVEESHVWISLGECEDQSLVILHATANGGVQLSGTEGEASILAGRYMEAFFPDWNRRYHGMHTKPEEYRRDYGMMSWDVSGTGILTDPEGLRNREAKEVLFQLFCMKEKNYK